MIGGWPWRCPPPAVDHRLTRFVPAGELPALVEREAKLWLLARGLCWSVAGVIEVDGLVSVQAENRTFTFHRDETVELVR